MVARTVSEPVDEGFSRHSSNQGSQTANTRPAWLASRIGSFLSGEAEEDPQVHIQPRTPLKPRDGEMGLAATCLYSHPPLPVLAAWRRLSREPVARTSNPRSHPQLFSAGGNPLGVLSRDPIKKARGGEPP